MNKLYINPLCNDFHFPITKLILSLAEHHQNHIFCNVQLDGFWENIMKLIYLFDLVFHDVTDINITIDNLILSRHEGIMYTAVSWSNIND